MAKYLTIEMRFADDVDVYSDVVQDGMIQATMTTEGVLSARIVGIGEGPDPVDETVNPEQNVPADPGNATQG